MIFQSIISTSVFFCSVFADSTNCKDSLKKNVISLESEVTLPSKNNNPFFLRNLSYGNVPIKGFNFRNTFSVKYSLLSTPKYSLKFESQMSLILLGKKDIILPVANLTFFSKNFEFYVGRRKEIFGLGDSLLTSGFYIWSGNALPIPKVHLGTSGFVPIRFTRNFIGINGSFAHGWFGKGDFATGYFLHQKTFYLRLAKPQHPLRFYLGGSHFAQWGGFAPKLIKYGITTPSGALPGSWNDYWNILLSRNLKETSATNLSLYQVGNQLGTAETMLEYSRSKNCWKAYFQHGIESRGIFNNLPDGLYGLSFRQYSNKNASGLMLKGITFEVLTTQNQNTQLDPNSNEFYNDDYFNHPLQYVDGWTYRDRIIGTPFMTLRTDVQDRWKDFYKIPDEEVSVKVINNRLWAIYVGSEWGVGESTRLFTKTSITKNFLSFDKKTGSYGTPVSQFSCYLGATQKLKFLGRTTATLNIAYDQGDLLSSGFGASLALRYNIY